MSRKNNTKNTIYLRLERPFLGLPNETIQCKELNQLAVHSRWLYAVLLTKFNREKDKVKKRYPFTFDEMGKITGYDNRRLAFCVRQLEQADFIEVVHGGKNNPSLYRPVLHWLY